MIILPIGDINPCRRKPIVNYTLIGLNTALFLILYFRSDYLQIVLAYGMIPIKNSPFTYFSSIFLHGSIWHLFGNMLYLWICGDNVEDRLGHLGFILLYLASGITAGLAHQLMNPASDIPCIGASGAIAGVLGAYVVLFPKSKIRFWYFIWIFIFIRFGTFYLASVWAIGFWFIEQLFLNYLATAYKMPAGVAYWAHIGGFASGLIVAVLLRGVGLVKGGVARKRTW